MYFGPMYMYGGQGIIYLLLIITAVLAIFAQIKVQSTFNKYAKVRSRTGMTGAEAAERILHSNGIYDVQIQMTRGQLTDNYNSSNKTLNLSESTYNSSSVAAIGVAAHECGHAIQHAKGYAFLNFRNAFFPLASFGSKFAFVFIIAGFIFSYSTLLLNIGIVLFSLAVIFQLVTLPVEFNASHRALGLLEDNGILYREEVGMTRKVLSAAALTYVASAASAVLQLIRLILISGGRNRD